MDSRLLFFDVEATGIPEWKKPSGDDCQPHLVSLAALLVDPDTRKTIQSMDVIIKPNGWVSDPEALEVHGINGEYANDVGITEKLAIEMFLALWSGRKRISFNTTYDNRLIRIGTKRYCRETIRDAWKKGSQGVEWYCTMLNSRKVMGGKQPKLADAYRYFFNKEPKDAHTAMGDAISNMEIFWAIQDALGAAA